MSPYSSCSRRASKSAEWRPATELVERLRDVAGEDVLDDADLGVVVEGQVDVLLCDEADRDPEAGGAEDCEADCAVGRAWGE